jgi:pimeloyl-ACP methyl ester carboxylesterase
MHYITINNTNLAFELQNPEAARTLFFIHGNSTSSRTWRYQLNSPMFREYRLIALDLPAHGKSEADPEKAYSLHALGATMAMAVKDLSDDKPFILIGISLGTNIVAEMLSYQLKPIGIVLASPCVVGKDFTLESMVLPGADTSAIFLDQPLNTTLLKYAQLTSSSTKDDDLALFLEDYHRVKNPFRSILFESIVAGKFSDQIELLRQAGTPLLTLFGKEDHIINPDYLDGAPLQLWKNIIHKIPNASHLVHIDQPELFNDLISNYTQECFKSDLP